MADLASRDSSFNPNHYIDKDISDVEQEKLLELLGGKFASSVGFVQLDVVQNYVRNQ